MFANRRSGLYFIGATPAAGKTTFCWQLLEQIARRDESCIYCSGASLGALHEVLTVCNIEYTFKRQLSVLALVP